MVQAQMAQVQTAQARTVQVLLPVKVAQLKTQVKQLKGNLLTMPTSMTKTVSAQTY